MQASGHVRLIRPELPGRSSFYVDVPTWMELSDANTMLLADSAGPDTSLSCPPGSDGTPVFTSHILIAADYAHAVQIRTPLSCVQSRSVGLSTTSGIVYGHIEIMSRSVEYHWWQ